MAAPLRPDLGDHVVAEDDPANPVALVEDAECSERRGLGRRHRFHVTLRAEEHRHALIDDDQGGAVSLLRVDAHMGLARTRSHFPIDRPHVVAGEIATQLLEVQPAPTHARGAAAVQHASRRLARQEAERLRLPLETAQMGEIDANPRIGRGFPGRPCRQPRPHSCSTVTHAQPP
jgi:hypothetical protein